MPMFDATYEAAKHRARNRWLLLILWLLLFCPVTKAQDFLARYSGNVHA